MLQFPGMTADDIKVFLIDAEEQLQALEDGLLELEQVGENEEVIGKSSGLHILSRVRLPRLGTRRWPG